MSVLIKRSQVESVKVDEATTINRYNFSTGAYDIVEANFDGYHGCVMNKVSTKSYYILSGAATFDIDGANYKVEAGDIITAEPNRWVNIKGENLKTLIISNPPFNPDDEEWK